MNLALASYEVCNPITLDDSIYIYQDDFCVWYLKRGAEVPLKSVNPAPLLRIAYNNRWMTFRDMVETAVRYGIPQEFIIVN